MERDVISADLHVHSRYSEHPSEWFLQRIGANESYTEPEAVYAMAKAQGMNFVTITDHNSMEGVLKLKERHPDDVFTGVEATAYFPEDGCKVHVLVWGLDEAEFAVIQERRTDIYALRDYLRERGLAHSVAHGTYAVNGSLTCDHLEKLVLLFDVFEAINGARHRRNNDPWHHLLAHLTPAHLAALEHKHGIAPFSTTPWIKGFTGGSDDHAGLFVGKTCTVCAARTPDEFVARIRQRQTVPTGRHNDYQSLALSIYKVAHDFSQQAHGPAASPLLGQLNNMLFGTGGLGFAGALRMRRIKMACRRGDSMNARLLDLIQTLHDTRGLPMEQKTALVCQHVTAIADEFLRKMLKSLDADLQTGNLLGIVSGISSSMPGLFLSVPFFTTLYHINESRPLADELRTRLEISAPVHTKCVLWFTDTLTELNGVAVTLQNIGRLDAGSKAHVRIVASLAPGECHDDLPSNLVNLPHIHSFSLPYCEQVDVKIPSVLASLDIIQRLDPDQIIISTPGPVGLIGLLAGKLLNVKTSGVYHTDFTLQASRIAGDDSLPGMLEAYTRWFYQTLDEIHVPTRQYMRILEGRGFDHAKMRLFRRGIDARLFRPHAEARAAVNERLGIQTGINLLYAGRVSKDKNIDFLLDTYRLLIKWRPAVNLIVVGDGPHLDAVRAAARTLPRIVCVGRVPHAELPKYYSAADLFVFPSTTDTFGQAVFEALACGLPAMVSDQGGARELVDHGATGFIVPADDPANWAQSIKDFIVMTEHAPTRHAAMRRLARRRVLQHADWRTTLQEILGQESAPPAATTPMEPFEPAVAEPVRVMA